jgi:hypothetical protein
MKNSPIALLNSLGCVNPSQKAAYAAHVLKAATVSSPAVTIVPAAIATLAKAVVAPAIAAIPGWSDAIEFTKAVGSVKIVAYLPYKSSPALIGAPTGLVDGINEITPTALQAMLWRDAVATATPGTSTDEPLTLEQYFYKQALAIVSVAGSTSTIESVTRTVNNVVVACKKITLNITAANYTLGVDALQMGKLG